jgi:Mono-functional DNA-alkylating methyl methanesulfonate N-term
MDFLVSPSNEPAKIILALLVSKNQATHMLLYSWEEEKPLRYAKLEASRRLPDRDRMPLMMIPSNQNASFTLVTESGITVYDDVLSSTYRCINIQLPQSFPEKFVGSCRSPLWAQWAKPYRHSGYLETNDDIFLVREDGELIYLEIKYKEPTKVSTQSAVDSLHINVDSAFAILEGPLDQGGDICVAGGDMSDGTVCHIKARAALERFQTIRNLAPIRDMLILDTTSRDEDAKRLFVCSGKGDRHAAVSEIRRGLEARIGFFADQEDSSMASGLWLVPEDISNQITLLASYPSQTSALRIVFKKETTEDENGESGESGDKTTFETADDDLANQGFQMSSQTLAFAGTKGGLLAQITTSAVTVLSPLSKTSAVDRRHAVRPILSATLHLDDLLFATIALVNDGFQVLLGSIDVSDATVSINDYCEPYLMVEEPSSIVIMNISGQQFLIIGTIAGSIHVLKIEPGQGLRLLSQYSLAKLFPHIEPSAICSLAVLTDAALTPSAVACGTRNGWLLGLNIVPGLRDVRQGEGEPPHFKQDEVDDLPHALTLQPESAQPIGHTSVKLIPDSESRSAALLFCDVEVHRITYPQMESVAGFQVSRIWFSDVSQVCHLPVDSKSLLIEPPARTPPASNQCCGGALQTCFFRHERARGHIFLPFEERAVHVVVIFAAQHRPQKAVGRW